MTRKLLSQDEFRDFARRGEGLGALVQRLSSGAAVEVTGADRTLRCCFSDESIDRAGDCVKVKGWILQPFRENSPILFAHNSSAPPIGRCPNVAVEGDRLMGDIEFAPRETYEFADTIYRLAKGHFINAVSVGFNPLEWTFVNDKDRPYGIDFLKQELLEVSLCPIPCNANALIEARSKGIDTRPLMQWAEQVLDEGGRTAVPRAVIEQTYKEAKSPRAIRRGLITPI